MIRQRLDGTMNSKCDSVNEDCIEEEEEEEKEIFEMLCKFHADFHEAQVNNRH